MIKIKNDEPERQEAYRRVMGLWVEYVEVLNGRHLTIMELDRLLGFHSWAFLAQSINGNRIPSPRLLRAVAQGTPSFRDLIAAVILDKQEDWEAKFTEAAANIKRVKDAMK